MRLLQKITAYLLVVMGIVHIALTPMFFRQFGLDVLWFAGTGLALIFLGNINLMVLISRRSGFYMMAITSNIMALLLVVVILSMNPSIQAYISFILVLLLTLSAVNEYIGIIKKMMRQNTGETNMKKGETYPKKDETYPEKGEMDLQKDETAPEKDETDREKDETAPEKDETDREKTDRDQSNNTDKKNT
jgi:hypothetical protein